MATIRAHYRSLFAVFASEEEAMRARSALLENAVDPNDIAISIDLTRDGIAAEAPGQAYENQGGAQSLWQLFKHGVDVDPDKEEARVLADIERGTVVLTVDPVPRSKGAIVVYILKEHGAVAMRELRLRPASSRLRKSSSPTQSS